MFVAQHIQHVCPTKNPGQDAGAHRRSHSIRHYTLLEKPSGAAESIVQAGLEDVEFVIGEGSIAAEVHHVVLNLRSPVVPQGIFGPDAKHPPADGLVDRDDLDAIYGDAAASVSPGSAKFAIDEPAIEGVTDPRSKRGDPIEAPATCHDGSWDGDTHAVPDGRPSDLDATAAAPSPAASTVRRVIMGFLLHTRLRCHRGRPSTQSTLTGR